jgi:hypothetical protein
MAAYHALDLDTFMDWLNKIAKHVCQELGFQQIVGPTSALLPVPVNGVSLRLDGSDGEGRYGFKGSAAALVALGLLARLSQAMKDEGEEGAYAGFGVREVRAAMALVDQDLAGGHLVVQVYKPWVRRGAAAS